MKRITQWSLAAVLLSSGMTGMVGEMPAMAQEARQTTEIKGTIKEKGTGLGVIGARVQVKGSTIGTVTNVNGEFTLRSALPVTLQVEYLGFRDAEIVVNSVATPIIIELEEDNLMLDELVVIGYGKVKKSDLSTSVGTVSNVDQVKERPINSVQEMLQGQIPGVTVVSNGGHLDSKPKVTIRGMGSRADETPLYVVDGVPGAPFSIGDVVSMTVLKDAASAAIYGAYAGSAGVILVTTKQAQAGKPTVSYSLVNGYSFATNLPQSLTIEEQRRVRAAALGGEKNLPDGWNVTKNPYIGQTRTDWIDAIFRTGVLQRHNIAVSAGNDMFSNRLSFEINDRNGTLLNTYNKSITTRLNSSFNISKHLRLREDFSWTKGSANGTNTTSAESGVILSAIMMPRNAEVYNPDGSFGGTAPSDPEYIKKYGSNFADIHGDVINPVRELTGRMNKNENNTLTSSTFLDIIEPVPGLNFTSRFTYSRGDYFYKGFSPRRTEPGKPDFRNTLNYSASKWYDWSTENTLNYTKRFNDHSIDLMASTTASEYQSRGFSAGAEDFSEEDESLAYFAQAGKFNTPLDSYAIDRNLSIVGRASYSYGDRYFITASMRRDYAGRLPEGHKYGDFPSFTGAWKISSEPFMKEVQAVSLLKLRASWGRIGNLGSIGLGYGVPLLSNSGANGDFSRGGQIGKEPYAPIGKAVTTAFNPNLTWETSEQSNYGIDLGLFKDRLLINADYFIKNTFGLIKEQDFGWPSTIGIAPMMVNDGQIRNSGFELSAGWGDAVGDFKYRIGANIATLKNEVISMGEVNEEEGEIIWTDGAGFKSINPYRTIVGQPLYSFYVYRTDGVFMSDDEAKAYKNSKKELMQPEAMKGDLKFVDVNGNGKIDEDDREFRGNAMPKLTYAVTGDASWKGLSLSLMLQGVSGVQLFHGAKYTTLNEANVNFNRQSTILKALDGPTPDVPRLSATDPNGNFETVSDFYLEDGSYLRIKNLTLGYDLTPLIQRWGWLKERNSTLALSFSVDNLATFTKYTGIDPEVGPLGFDGMQYPVSRTFSFGIKLNY